MNSGTFLLLTGAAERPFSPADLAGLALWLDPAYGLFQERTGAAATTPAADDGDPVGTWAARTGQYCIAPSDAARPTLQTVNGKRVVRFDGVDDHLTWAGEAFAGQFYALMAVDQTGDNALFGGAAGAPQLRIGQAANRLSTFDSSANNPQSTDLSVAQGNWSRVAFQVSGGIVVFWQNDIWFSFGFHDGTETFTAVGAFNTAAPANLLAGDVGDALLYDTSPAPADRARLNVWLMARHP